MSSVSSLGRRALQTVGLLDWAKMTRASVRYASPSLVVRHAKYRVFGAPDGMPVPPSRLIWLVIGHGWSPIFFDSGATIAAAIRRDMVAAGVSPTPGNRILDFGCGVGRLLRHFVKPDGPEMHGSDYNPELIRWARRTIPGATFGENGLAPPLSYPDSHFQAVYAQSVWTHLDLPLQQAWMREMRRVLAPGGILRTTLHGDQMAQRLAPEQRKSYDAGEIVVEHGTLVGKNDCGAIQSRAAVERYLLDGFEIVAHRPGRPVMHEEQDVYVFRRT